MKRPLAVVLLFLAVDAHCWAQRGPVIRGPVAPRPVIPGPRPVIPPAPRPVVRPGPIIVHRVGEPRGVESEDDSVASTLMLVLAVLGGVGGVVALGFGIYLWSNRIVAHLRILDPPPGDAPEDIRRAWVGVKLPLRRWEARPIILPSAGGYSDEHGPVTMGYAVDGRAAIDALDAYDYQAAAWWRDNAPHVLTRGYRLHFPEEMCMRVE